ncbi:MAG: hypothetical protein LBD23_04815 [Oscillospiraceae bacterium]|jgi:hypothetical protein|nr:hypothetical protein [Oscillospiraceae bacterium]
MDYKNGKWASKILELQHDNGSWGFFHGCGRTKENPFSTEQALGKLENLGFTIDDRPIQMAVKYMNSCLIGKENIPDRVEKVHDWKIFTDLMLSTRIKRFTQENTHANEISDKWAEIVNCSFTQNKFDQDTYNSIYHKILNPEKRKRIIGFMNYYLISLLANKLEKDIEPTFFEYVLNYNTGIYYFGYDKAIKILPEEFVSKETGRYMRQIELLTGYENKKCKKQLHFIKEWLEKNKTNKNEWDMGNFTKNEIQLSDSWRKAEDRIKDCTYVINKIMDIMR